MSSVNLYDRRPSPLISLFSLHSFPPFSIETRQQIGPRQKGRRRLSWGSESERGVRSVKLHFCEKSCEGVGDCWPERGSCAAAARSVYYERRRGEGSLTPCPHSKVDEFACLKNFDKHFTKFLGSVRVGTTRKTWSQTPVTSRALVRILKNCIFTLKTEEFCLFITILGGEFCFI